MANAASSEALTTVADLLVHLDDIPATRIRLDPPPGTATEDDLLRLHDRENRLCELVDGVLVEKPMGFYESRLAVVIVQLLANFADSHDLGIVAGADGMVRLAPGLVRIPDVSFVCWEQLPDGRVPRDPIPDLSPDLAVEVLSRGNTPREMRRKVREYFDAGVRLVWLLDPEARTMTVHRSVEDSVVLAEEDIISGGDVLPGFRVRLGELFDRTGRAMGSRGPG